MKKLLSLTIFIFLFSACSNKKETKKVPRISITPEIISEEMMTSFPGILSELENVLIWTNPLSKEYLLHLVDKKTGEEVSAFGSQGGGPDELTNAFSFTGTANNEVLVYDLNYKKCLFFPIEYLLAGDNRPVKNEKWPHSYNISKITHIENNKFVYSGTEEKQPFILVDSENNTETPFGAYPIKESENIVNKHDYLQGVPFYNPHKKVFLYSMGDMSYMSLYQYEKGQFKQKWEKRFSDVKYEISNNQLNLIETPERAPTALALTKDYIVSIERDKEDLIPHPLPTGLRDPDQRPHTLFIYDYDMNLLKIVNLGFPIIRLAANGSTNDVYFIGVNPEYCIGKCKL